MWIMDVSFQLLGRTTSGLRDAMNAKMWKCKNDNMLNILVSRVRVRILARFRVRVKLGLVLGFELELGQVIVIVLA